MAGPPHPTRPRVSARWSYGIAPLVAPNALYRRIATRLVHAPRLRALFTAAERRSKEALFGCRMCGQCALPATAYACPMTCPKELRNGPCGGVSPNGDCEVHPGERCVWLIAHERAAAAGRGADLTRLHRPVDHRLSGSSSWVNYWLGRDEGLWTGPAPERPPPLPDGTGRGGTGRGGTGTGRVDLGMPGTGRHGGASR